MFTLMKPFSCTYKFQVFTSSEMFVENAHQYDTARVCTFVRRPNSFARTLAGGHERRGKSGWRQSWIVSAFGSSLFYMLPTFLLAPLCCQLIVRPGRGFRNISATLHPLPCVTLIINAAEVVNALYTPRILELL